jgi:hypothetical protein
MAQLFIWPMAEVIARNGTQPTRSGHTGPWLCNGLLLVLTHGHTTHKV